MMNGWSRAFVFITSLGDVREEAKSQEAINARAGSHTLLDILY